MFAEEDEFLRENRYSNYGEVASNIEDFLKRISDKKKSTQNINSFEDMKKVLDSMPEMRRESGNLNKHYELIDELIKKIKLRRLLDIGEIEQSLVAKENKNESFKAISDIIPDEKFSSFDLLRLCVLFNLKYEGDPKAAQLFSRLKERLGAENVSKADSYNKVIEFAGKKQRVGSLFMEDSMDLIKKKVTQHFKDIPNVYTQFRPYAETLFEEAMKGKLKETEYVPTDSRVNTKIKQHTIFLYFIGGITFAESRVVKELRLKYPDTEFYLGGSHLLHAVR